MNLYKEAHSEAGQHVTAHVHVLRHIIFVKIPGCSAGRKGVDYKRSLKKATKEALSGELPIHKQVEVCTCTCM